MTNQELDGFFDFFTGVTSKPPIKAIGPQLPGKKKTSGGVFDFLTALAPKAFKTAEAYGINIPLPLGSEINSLDTKLKALRGLSYQADDIKRLHIPRLEARKTANASQLARNITTALNQAKAQGDAASRLINAALTEGRTAQEKMKFGTILAKPTAAFFVKKKIADDNYMKAKTRFDQAIAVWQEAERRIASEPVPMVKQVAQTIYSSGAEFASKASRALVATGRAAESAIESTGSLAPYAKYLPYALGAAAVLYLTMLLPRSAPTAPKS